MGSPEVLQLRYAWHEIGEPHPLGATKTPGPRLLQAVGPGAGTGTPMSRLMATGRPNLLDAVSPSPPPSLSVFPPRGNRFERPSVLAISV